MEVVDSKNPRKENQPSPTEGKNIRIGLDAGTSLTTGHHNILIGQEAGKELTTENYRLIIKGKSAFGNLVDIDKTMSESEFDMVADAVAVTVALIGATYERATPTPSN